MTFNRLIVATESHAGIVSAEACGTSSADKSGKTAWKHRTRLASRSRMCRPYNGVKKPRTTGFETRAPDANRRPQRTRRCSREKLPDRDIPRRTFVIED